MANPLPDLSEFDNHAPKTLVQTGYLSHAHGPLTPNELVDIRMTSLRKNRNLEIGGVLITNQAKVFQILEGPCSAVQGLLKTIALDSRHHSLKTFAVTPVDERAFEDWGMAVRRLKGRQEADRDAFNLIFEVYEEARSPLALDEIRITFFQKLAKNSSRDLWLG